MTQTPLVSILVGFLNAEQFLEETIASVFGQTLEDWQLILVDDGSSDGSSAIARRHSKERPEKVIYLTHPGNRNRGVCASRNLALNHARGRFIAILDADDVWLPEKLARQIEILTTYSEVGMVFGAARYWRSWSNTVAPTARDYTPRLGIESDTIHHPPGLLRRCHPLGRAIAPCPSDLLLRKEVLLSINGFEEEFTGIYQMYEDQAFLAKVYLSTSVFAASESWTLYRLHEGSCCHRVESSGNELHVRDYYLTWLKNYLHTKGIRDIKTHRALGRAQMLVQHPWVGGLANLPSTIKEKTRNMIRRFQTYLA